MTKRRWVGLILTIISIVCLQQDAILGLMGIVAGVTFMLCDSFENIDSPDDFDWDEYARKELGLR